ncbi:hypoxanthine phosphoribosyltransferase [Clostridium gasigenes]|uniref:Hypoxanthine phosphoribosyltransferase n=1 Tax=Clostridium gasigenes TaxID=94869 RepID=A0A7X0V527_9CLOT|nr:hypoxanthine phosphoribosyltransferase [Clostridium gasigenes]MBB6622004.1 hypoxanthine phosphoribosyltransferase [Clostridium gasigenes]MBB6716685.1 hypoxanthine phosphoribosyltransferase [Clostridium gasigenes]
MENKKRNILFTEDQIKTRTAEIGKIITEDFKGKKLYVLPLLRGSFIFGADLFRELDCKAKVGFMTTSSYGDSETSTGTIEIINDIPDDIKGWDILIVDDIVDTGTTMDYVINHVKNLGAASVKSCVLLDKPSRRKVDIKPDYCCFEIEDLFVVGYGLDYEGFYRNIPYVFNWQDN